jgi:hypothetical protein
MGIIRHRHRRLHHRYHHRYRVLGGGRPCRSLLGEGWGLGLRRVVRAVAIMMRGVGMGVGAGHRCRSFLGAGRGNEGVGSMLVGRMRDHGRHIHRQGRVGSGAADMVGVT